MSILVDGQVVPLPAQLALEIELFYRHMESLDSSDSKAIGVCRSEVMQRSDLYKRCVREQYKRIVDVRPNEKIFLTDFFRAMRGHNWKMKFGWVGQKKTISKPELKVLAGNGSQFFGALAAGDRLQGLDLSANCCEGLIPSIIGNINNCKFLKLNWNRIRGSIPKDLRMLSELQILHLFSNSLEGSLDQRTMESLVNLRSLNLSFNCLTGALPDAFSSSVHLEEINLSGNRFSGELPLSMRSLKKLKTLKLYRNEFTGDIPEWIEELQDLIDVNLSHNRFKGGLRPFYGCRQLRHLILCHNQIGGPVEEEIAQLENIKIMYISYNRLEGPLPRGICALQQLTNLNLSNNNIDGTLPSAIGELTKLETCILGHNLIVGPVPLSIAKLKSLRDFELFTAAPTETLYIPRAFEKKAFQRIYEWGPSARLDNVSWDDPDAAAMQVVPLSVDTLVAAVSSSESKRGSPAQEPVFSPSISRWLEEADRK